MDEFTHIARRVLISTALTAFTFALSATFNIETAHAQRYASKQRTSTAVGHYARARAMMVEALKEFEQGRRLARPDLLLDSEDFRLKLISLTEDLNRVVDPKPRVTREGAVFRANPRLIKRERNALPPVPGGPQDSNVYGEAQRLKELEQARARMYQQQSGGASAAQPSQAAPEPAEEATAPAEEHEEAGTFHEPAAQEAQQEAHPEPAHEDAAAHDETAAGDEEEEDAGEEQAAPEPAPANQQAAADEDDDEGYMEDGAGEVVDDDGTNEAAMLKEEGKDISQDQEIANAIEKAIQDRIKNLENSNAAAGEEHGEAVDSE